MKLIAEGSASSVEGMKNPRKTAGWRKDTKMGNESQKKAESEYWCKVEGDDGEDGDRR